MIPVAQRIAGSAALTGDQMFVRCTSEDGALPAIFEPATGVRAASALSNWIGRNRALVDAELLRHGAVLLRGFDVTTPQEFESITQAVSNELIEYSERSSPRSQVQNKVYTSTDYPASQRIFPHNEHSYAITYPLHLFFCCLEPAARGGETPLANIRNVTARISDATRERFERTGWMWMRNFGYGMGLSWQTTFQTADKAQVEMYCRRSGIAFEWIDSERLRTRQVRPVMAVHPSTGERLWFNHATFFHVSTLDAVMRDVLTGELADNELPNNTYYGDGQPIPPTVLDELRAAYEREMVTFPWRAGDVLLVDNMLTAHARASFAGSRRVLVTMADPITRTDIQVV
jgi:alpha-ketoglutarate-dependent taurine dioxygenase